MRRHHPLGIGAVAALAAAVLVGNPHHPAIQPAPPRPTPVASPNAPAQLGQPMPNPELTPGVADPAATLDIVCNTGTKSRRMVTPQQRQERYAAYGVTPPLHNSGATQTYELDHLIPLELGGSNDSANLWPQPAPSYRAKDKLENVLHDDVCTAHSLTLQQAQQDIARDWVTAYQRYVGGNP